MSLREISRITRIGRTTITNIACGHTETIFPDTLKQILSTTNADGAPRAAS